MTDETDETALSAGFTLFTVLDVPRTAGVDVDELDRAIAEVEATGVTVRGFYDLTGMRAGASIMTWLHGDVPEALQAALRTLRRTGALTGSRVEWTAMGVHREAEFNKRHIPGYLRGEAARDWLCLYPFVRSYEWYLLPEAERSAMLADHGRKGAAFRDVVANTVSTFALSDYEWLLPLESDNLTSLVDLMRALRATDARRHVREEVPFYTGRRIQVAELAEVLA
ncbi:chlorite dismutase family protein [Microbacterium sediminicola]|uniref:Coproheme decarboxylase n=1 Tax=Microbacterium sediminicola TaxID=415210 RepID=A0ABN2I2T5_9MICO